MRYIEVTVNTPEEELDSRCELLSAMGVDGFVIENEADFRDFLENNRQYWDYVDSELEQSYAGVSRIKFYLRDDGQGHALLKRILLSFPDALSALTEDKDWENSWKESYSPIEVGEHLVVVPSWMEAPDNGRIPLFLDPGIAFGAGSHATTRMCLAALEPYVRPGARCLDLGCGSGILGIAALVLGAGSVLGVDIDPKSPDAVMMNAALNSLDGGKINALSGDLISDASLRAGLGGGYDVVLANIVADVIIRLCPHVGAFMKKDAVFICSGIIQDRVGEVETALHAAGFTVSERRSEDEWRQYTCILER